ncbi:MAG: murein biosynthesis integral membrane protein MurJ [Acidimicrobiia bacterium]
MTDRSDIETSNSARAAMTDSAVAVAVARPATAIGVATAVSRLAGFCRVLVVAAVLGTTELGDTFFASNAVSNALFDLLAAGALSSALVPSFVELLDSKRSDEAEHLAGFILGVALVALGVVAALGVAAAPLLARLLTSGVDAQGVDRQRELATFLLRLFIPQLLLYALGAVSMAVLHAKRRFVAAAVAPIGNTVVMVGFILLFQALRSDGSAAPVSSLPERLSLGAAGTLGVAAFVGIPALALRRSGFRLRPRLRGSRELALRALRISAWAGLQQAGAGLLLGVALVAAMPISGATVAYQVAFACFLVPYAVLAQPILSAVLPELSSRAAGREHGAFADAVRWSLRRMAALTLPATAAGVALAPHVGRLVSFGDSAGAGSNLIANALAALSLGLYPYGAFLLLARASYALGDGRSPALAAISASVASSVGLLAVAGRIDGSARLLAIGLAHGGAYLLAGLMLLRRLEGRLGARLLPSSGLVGAALSGLGVALGARLVVDALSPASRLELVASLAGVGGAGAALLFRLDRRRGGGGRFGWRGAKR